MLSPTREKVTSAATFWATAAACAALLFPVAAKVLPENPLLASSVWGIAAVKIQAEYAKNRNSQYKKLPLPPSDSINAQPLPPTGGEKSPNETETRIEVELPVEEYDVAKTKRFLIVPEGYDAETLASEPFRAALQRYQEFLQQHFPAELITVGIAYPEQSIPSVTPDAELGHVVHGHHPLQEEAEVETDAVLILLNGEQYRLAPNSDFDYQTAVSWGPSATGIVDFEMLEAALHESLHLCPVSSEAGIHDSYKDDLSPWHEEIDSFNHSGYLPYVPREKWPDTLVTRAIKEFDVPLYRYTEDGKDYWAVSNRANVMDSSILQKNPVNLAAFLLAGGQYVDQYQQYLVCHGTINELEQLKRITAEEATARREKFSPDFIKASTVSPLEYLTQSFKER